MVAVCERRRHEDEGDRRGRSGDERAADAEAGQVLRVHARRLRRHQGPAGGEGKIGRVACRWSNPWYCSAVQPLISYPSFISTEIYIIIYVFYSSNKNLVKINNTCHAATPKQLPKSKDSRLPLASCNVTNARVTLKCRFLLEVAVDTRAFFLCVIDSACRGDIGQACNARN